MKAICSAVTRGECNGENCPSGKLHELYEEKGHSCDKNVCPNSHCRFTYCTTQERKIEKCSTAIISIS